MHQSLGGPLATFKRRPVALAHRFLGTHRHTTRLSSKQKRFFTILCHILRGLYCVINFRAWWFVQFEKMPDDVSIKDIEKTLVAVLALPARIFEYHDLTETRKHPLLMHFHGGGGCVGSVYTTHESCFGSWRPSSSAPLW
mmetsp:Transcript_19291/g.28559  ORF Transcript_19291/g.28559 Transcript_19291/m.28559 type:complete len:140 (+) Transcript_19291:3377-3796(+)